jgi:hypothetical protein
VGGSEFGRLLKVAKYITGNEIGITRHAGPGSVIPDLIRDQDDGSGIQAVFLDSGYRIVTGTGFARMTLVQVFNRRSNIMPTLYNP